MLFLLVRQLHNPESHADSSLGSAVVNQNFVQRTTTRRMEARVEFMDPYRSRK
jgi:hypothetical protein